MKKLVIFVLILIGIIAVGFWYRSARNMSVEEKIYVAVEMDGTIAVINALEHKVMHAIDLSANHERGKLLFMPHNVQVAPDGKTVWVTANAGGHMDHTSIAPKAFAHGEEEEGMGMESEPDEIIVIDPHNDAIIKRIAIGTGLHLAHVVLTPDNNFAYVTAQNEGVIYKINAHTYELVRRIKAVEGSEPHGMRIAPDGSQAYIAMSKGKALGIVDLKTDVLRVEPLRGVAVQTGVTPNGSFATVSLYDTKQLAIYDVRDKTIAYVALPETARGPIQMYPTPDSRFMYLADQGYYFGEPEGDQVYKIDLAMAQVVKSIKVGSAPHGVVVSKNGKFVYITNIVGGDVSVVDAATDMEIARIPVGKSPNGISIWSRERGGTP